METAPKLGPVGIRVASNLKSLREDARRLTVRELSARLRALGRPVLPSGISKIEAEQRRVDADDLVALAIALDVTPNRLLLDSCRDRDAWVALAPASDASSATAWAWACGDDPLRDAWDDRAHHFDFDRVSRFRLENRPHDPDEGITIHDWETKFAEPLAALHKAVGEARAAGLSTKQIISAVRLFETMQRIGDNARRLAKGRKQHGKR